MSTFLSEEKLWQKITELSKKSKRVRAIVGFVGTNPHEVIHWPKRSELFADLSVDTVKRGASSARGAMKLLKRGVRVFHTPALHAKIYLFDRAAIVCSANASESSQRLIEAGVLLRGSHELATIQSFVSRLFTQHDTVELDDRILSERIKVEPKRKKSQGRGHTANREGDTATRIWLIPAFPDDDETSPEATAKRTYLKHHSLPANHIQWYNQCGKKLYKNLREGDHVYLLNNGTHKWSRGYLEGPLLSIGGVDLGARFRSRRYCLPLVDRRSKEHKLDRNEFVSVRKMQEDYRNSADAEQHIRSKAVLLTTRQRKSILRIMRNR